MLFCWLFESKGDPDLTVGKADLRIAHRTLRRRRWAISSLSVEACDLANKAATIGLNQRYPPAMSAALA